MMDVRRFELQAEGAGLVVIDWQERLTRAMPVDVCRHNETNAMTLVRAFQELGRPVLVTEQYPAGLGRTTHGLQFALGEFQPAEKTAFSATNDEGFKAAFEALDVDAVVLCGMETHVCVYQTALGMLQHGRRVFVPRDAVVSRSRQSWKTGLELLRDAGCVVASTETICFQLLGRAGTPAFKAIAGFLKDPEAAWQALWQAQTVQSVETKAE